MTFNRLFVAASLAGVIMTAIGCTSPEASSTGNPSSTASASTIAGQTAAPPSPSAAETQAETQASSTYALQIGDERGLLHLQDWDDRTDLEGLLGKPLSQKMEALENADTLTGSFVKELTYEGLRLELFSPKQNGQSFWVMSMEATAPQYETPDGIAVGNTVADVKKAYPGIAIGDGRTDPDNASYLLSDKEGRNLEFEVKDGTVAKIHLFFLIP